MDTISAFLKNAYNTMTLMRFSDILDILIVAFLIYEAIMLIRKTNSLRVARGILVLLLAFGVSEILDLTMINMLLRKTVELGLIALVILFQPELRRLLERVGSGKLSNLIYSGEAGILTMDSVITQTVLACSAMSKTKTGALIVFERTTGLNDPMSTGTIVNADVTSELLRNIFYEPAPLHDGAVIIRDGRLAAAGCMLPLSNNVNLSRDLGMRHRAGIGMSEHSDAVSVIVSEETGAISIAIDGLLKRHLSPEICEKILRSELIRDTDGEDKKGIAGILSSISGFVNNKVKKNDKKQ